MVTCVSYRDNTNTLPRFLRVETYGVYFSSWWVDHAVFASAIASYTDSCKTLSHRFACDEFPFPIPSVYPTKKKKIHSMRFNPKEAWESVCVISRGDTSHHASPTVTRI